MFSEKGIEVKSIVKLSLPFAVLISFLAAYWPVVQKLMLRWSSGDNSYAYLIPPLFLYLCCEQRSRLNFLEFSWNIRGFLLIALSICLMILGELGSVETFLYFGLWGCFCGLFIWFYGNNLRTLLFPFFILLFIVPLPSFVNSLLTFKLKMAATSLSVAMLRKTGISVLQEGNIIDLAVDRLQVVDACSGLRFFIPLILTSLLVGHYYLKTKWSRLILILTVPPLAILINSVRLWGTGLLTVSGHPELAENFFHDFSGWFTFLCGAGVLTGIAVIWGKTENNRIWPQPLDLRCGRGISVYSLVLSVAVSLVFCGSGWALQRLPERLVMPERSEFVTFPLQLGQWSGVKQELSQKIMDSLWADDYVKAVFIKKGSVNRIHLLIPYYKYQNTLHTAHAPQACLLGSGWTLESSDKHLIRASSDHSIQIMVMNLEKRGQRLVGSYFFLQRGRVIISPWKNKLYLAWDSLIRRRSDGALVRVEVEIGDNEDYNKAYLDLEDFILHLWKSLPKFVPA